MSYQTILDGIEGIMQGLTYQRSESADIKDVSNLEYGNTYILKSLSGEVGENSEQLADRFYDNQVWEIQMAFSLPEVDIVHIAKDVILAKLDDPASWISFARMMKYQSWKLEETANYFLLTITLSVVDVYTY